MNSEDEPFLRRWSRRKAEAKDQPADTGDGAVEGEGEAGLEQASEDPSRAKPGETTQAKRPRILTEEDFADVDFDALDMQSDYSRFLAPGVPHSIKYKALQKLWASDTVFSSIDPFQDYAADYTDAAVAVPAGTLKTAYRIGKGFLSDDEVAEWEKLGLPETEADATAKAAGAAVQPAVIALEAADRPGVEGLIRQSDAYLAGLYPARSNHTLDVAALMGANVRFVVARRENVAIGCGALVLGTDGEAELKRMFVMPDARGQDLGRAILVALEDAAKASGVRVIRLETGRRQPEAVALYRAQHYSERGPFGAYEKDPLSVFMEKWVG